MKRRTAPRTSSSLPKSRARRTPVASNERSAWQHDGEMGAHEFVAETSLSSSGGDFGFPAETEERSDAN